MLDQQNSGAYHIVVIVDRRNARHIIQIPDAHGFVAGACHDVPVVGVEVDSEYPVRVAREGAHDAARRAAIVIVNVGV